MFAKLLKSSERRVLSGLTTPAKLQTFLDSVAYNPDGDHNRCPVNVLRERKGHCFEGAVFAAAVLRDLGHPPLIVNMFPEPETDDEHMVAIFRKHGGWGAVAKSNVVGLRFREPVYRNLRELMMSYFEQYFNLDRLRSFRYYTRPLSLAGFDRFNWLCRDEAMLKIEKKLATLRQIPLLTRPMVKALTLIDDLSYKAGLMGSNPEGLFVPGVTKRGKKPGTRR